MNLLQVYARGILVEISIRKNVGVMPAFLLKACVK